MRSIVLASCLLLALPSFAPAASAGRVAVPGALLPAGLVDLGALPADHAVSLAVGLPLRNVDQLDALLADLQDPASPSYHHFLAPADFDARFAPTDAQVANVRAWLEGAGLTVTDVPSDHLLISAVGDNAAIERATGVALHQVSWNGQAHSSVVAQPTVPAGVAADVTTILGLDDLVQMRPHFALSDVQPHDDVAGFCCLFGPTDARAFYDNPTTYQGTGQTIAIVGAYAWQDSDVAAFNSQFGLPALSGSQVCAGSGSACSFDASNSIEISLDVEWAHATAPSATIVNVMAPTTAFTDFAKAYNYAVNNNVGHTVSTSWGACDVLTSVGGLLPESIFSKGAAQGQSFFAASGDSGALDCGVLVGAAPGVDYPASSAYVMGVGGTSVTCLAERSFTFGLAGPSACTTYGTEIGWSGASATGAGGGVSALVNKPSWQTGCTGAAGVRRMVPDVSLMSDPNLAGYYVYEDSQWWFVGGTSAAAPQWAGYFAELNQKIGGSGLGNPGPRLYALCGTAAFHDILVGDNGIYPALPGYDMITGIGTPDVAQLESLY